MKRSLLICTIIVLATVFSSCKKYLDVKPEDKFLESTVFSSASGFTSLLNGIYIDMGATALYGENLTLTTVDVLGQQYNVSATSTHSWYYYANYTYTNSTVQAKISTIWTSAYALVMENNNLLEDLDKHKGVLTPLQDSIIRGEAHAIRAYLHFDMLRLFGPVYAVDSAKTSIPYVTATSIKTQPLLPANQLIDSVLADLDKAESCLRVDPVITGGPQRFYTTADLDFFSQQRNGRLNYYAVKALKARVLLYRNDKTGALAQAKAVINNAGQWFPWTTLKIASSNTAFPDRTFSTEHLFDLYCANLYTSYTNNFSPDVADLSILAANPTRLTATYESLEGDYRYNPSWVIPSTGNKSYRCFYKFSDVTNKDSSTLFRFRMPMLRMSEMYYIAAECETDSASAIADLNTVRYNRGLANLPATAVLTTEIKKEYQKEFYGEGQLFFYYKRKNQATVPKGGATSGNFTMTAAYYVLPLPTDETDYR